MHVTGASLTPTSPGFESSHEAFTFAIQRVYMYIHPSIFYYCFLGSLRLLESVPAVFGRWPVSLWTSRLFITRPHKKTNNCSHSRFASRAFLFFFFLFECGTKQGGRRVKLHSGRPQSPRGSNPQPPFEACSANRCVAPIMKLGPTILYDKLIWWEFLPPLTVSKPGEKKIVIKNSSHAQER